MKSFLIALFLALAIVIHASATSNSGIRAHPDGEAERAAGMADAVTPEYKKVHGVIPELEAMILADGSGGQGTRNYYESFVPVNLMDESTKKQAEASSYDGLVISIDPQSRGHTVVTAISSIVAVGGIAATPSFTVTTATSNIICTSQEHPSWAPSPIRLTRTKIVGPPTPSRSPITTITVTLTTRTTTLTSPPMGTVTISHIISSNLVRITTIHPTLSLVTATAVTSDTSNGPARTSALIPTSTEHPSDTPTKATALDPIPKPSSNMSLTRLYPTSTAGHGVGTVSVYPIPTSNLTTIIPTVIPPTTLVTRARDPTGTIG